MKRFLLAALSLLIAAQVSALDGDPGLHDPSTIIEENGRYYTYATGGGIPISVSDDGWTWERMGSVADDAPDGIPSEWVLERGGRNSWAPDIIRSGDQYFLYYSAPGQQPLAAIGLLRNTTLDPNSPDYLWEDGGPVVWSDGFEDSNSIDPGIFRDPTDGSMWLVYGSYFGYIRLVQIDPETGQRLFPDEPELDVAINSEAAIMIFNDGWYYLLVTHGSCCRGAESTYNIRMGRSRNVEGPFIDNMGIDMIQGGGKLFLGSGGRRIGPGHFGLLDLGDGIQKFSLHYEADLDQGGRSVLDIRPLLWRDGWPVAGDHLEEGVYEIQSARTGTALELAVEGVPAGGPRRFGPPGGGALQITVVPDQDVNEVSANWPQGDIDVRMSPYLLQAQQKWEITAVDGAGGVPGAPYYRITIAGTDLTLTATAESELVASESFTGAPEQLWRIDQFTDGTWRLMPKAVPGSDEGMTLSAVGSSKATLDVVDGESDRQRWLINTP